MSGDRNKELQKLAHKYIPGGAHTYSRGDDQFPENAPKILSRGLGCYAWDADGNRFLDYGMALRSVTLGYAHEAVGRAAMEEIKKGNNLTRASETEIMAAQALCETIPGADMVKFAKNGSNVVTAATKLARAYTGRKMIARCAQHPFFSFDDWFIGSTVVTSGVPEDISKLTLQFNFNDLNSVKALFDRHPNEISCIVMEPATSVEPEPGFLQGLIDIAHKHGTVVIFDEMITGFRWSLKGACDFYNVKPDLLTFGKAMANGFSVAALAGKREIMELGGLNHDQDRVFLLSSTHGAEMSSLGALLEVMKIYATESVTEHLWDYGNKLIRGLNDAAKTAGMGEFFRAEGVACSPQYVVKDASGQVSLPLRTLFLQEMLKHQVLMPWIALSTAHGEMELEKTLNAALEALKVCKKALDNGIEKYLVGPAVKPVFRRKN